MLSRNPPKRFKSGELVSCGQPVTFGQPSQMLTQKLALQAAAGKAKGGRQKKALD